MSRLDSFIRRLEAQRSCLDLAAGMIRDLPGPVLELGLGHGRTYDHLRQVLPERDIYVFERQVDPAVAVSPDAAFLILGDIHRTLPGALDRFAARVPLIHADIGTGDSRANARIAGFIKSYLPQLLVPGGLVIADQDLGFEGACRVPPPANMEPGRYNLYRSPVAHARSTTTGT